MDVKQIKEIIGRGENQELREDQSLEFKTPLAEREEIRKNY